jgi:hypothetical protein
MTFEFSKYAKLDPALAHKELEVAHGSPIFDKWGHLDPHRANKQIETSLDMSLDVFDGLDDSERSRIHIEDKVNEGGAPYVAKAVHFSGGAYLKCDSLLTANSTVYSMVAWVKYPDPLTDTLFFHVTDPENNFINYAIIEKTGNPCSHFDAVLSNADSSSNYELTGISDGTTPNPVPGHWYCFITSFDLGHVMGAKTSDLYVGDSNDAGSVSDQQGPITIAMHGLPMWIGNSGFDPTVEFDAADWRIMPGVSLLTDGHITEATRRLFIDEHGKPVDPAVATEALGTPSMLFSGDHTGFVTNKGTGGTFTLFGTLTDASTSPST